MYIYIHTHIYTYICMSMYINETYLYMRLDLRYIYSRQKLFITAF